MAIDNPSLEDIFNFGVYNSKLENKQNKIVGAQIQSAFRWWDLKVVSTLNFSSEFSEVRNCLTKSNVKS